MPICWYHNESWYLMLKASLQKCTYYSFIYLERTPGKPFIILSKIDIWMDRLLGITLHTLQVLASFSPNNSICMFSWFTCVSLSEVCNIFLAIYLFDRIAYRTCHDGHCSSWHVLCVVDLVRINNPNRPHLHLESDSWQVREQCRPR